MRAQVTLSIKYDDEPKPDENLLRNRLEFAMQHLASQGLLSDPETIVDEWKYDIKFTND